jgi:hypothetical protein
VKLSSFFDHLKNTLYAGASNMQRGASLNGWMFINHLSMKIIYKLFFTLKNTPLSEKQKLNHKYSIKDVIEHLKAVKIIKFGNHESVIADRYRAAKILLGKMDISIT